MPVDLPLTGSGGTTATVATELLSTQHYQLVKLVNGVAGSSVAGTSATFLGTVWASSGVILGAGSSANMLG